jgi:hypothetical protein
MSNHPARAAVVFAAGAVITFGLVGTTMDRSTGPMSKNASVVEGKISDLSRAMVAVSAPFRMSHTILKLGWPVWFEVALISMVLADGTALAVCWTIVIAMLN